MCNENGGDCLGLPDDTEKPLFVYGNLKPDELGYDLIPKQVSDPQPAEVPGRIWVRDGVPLADFNFRGGSISGCILTLSPEGYDKVGKFEPAEYYQWSPATCVEPAGLEVNVLGPAAGLTPERGGGDVLYEPWSTASDPLFTHGLATVAETLRRDGRRDFEDDIPFDDRGEWMRFYRLQAAYMLACSILERIAFRIAPNDGPTQAVKAVGRQVESAVEEAGVKIPQRAVYRADKPRKKANLTKPGQFADWAYQIRCNLGHRGKSAWDEAELVRTALIDLHDVLRVYLLKKVPAFRKTWTEGEPSYQAYCWRIKAEFDASSGD